MSKVINIVGYSSNVGKTFLMESLIKELKNRGYSIATIKHDVHGFAMIKELHEEIELSDIIKMLMDKDIILVEGYKNSNLRKIEVYRDGVSDRIITQKEKLIAIASDTHLDIDNNINVVNKDDVEKLVDLIEKEEEFKFENYQ